MIKVRKDKESVRKKRRTVEGNYMNKVALHRVKGAKRMSFKKYVMNEGVRRLCSSPSQGKL